MIEGSSTDPHAVLQAKHKAVKKTNKNLSLYAMK